MKKHIWIKIVLLIAALLLLTAGVHSSVAYLVDHSGALVNVFNATHVDVTVDDDVTGNVKSNVVIKNTGDIDVYIRARIVGSWVDDESGLVVKAWDPNTDGTFVGLPGTGWEKEADGCYYYGPRVSPGSTTEPLFTSYTVTATVEGAHFVMDILVQAIQADGGASWNATSTSGQ